MKTFSLLLLLPAFAWGDAPKVEPPKIEVEARELFQFSVAAEKGKKLVAGKLPADKFVVFPLADGSFVGQSRKGVQGTFVLQFWHAGDTVKLPDAAPLPALPVATLTVVVGEPEPKPKPDDPKPAPDVIPTTAMRMLIVEEEQERTALPPAKQLSMFAEVVWDAVGRANVRVIDKDDDVSKLDSWYRTAFERARGKPLPYVVVGNGRKQFEGPLPDNYLDMVANIRKLAE